MNPSFVDRLKRAAEHAGVRPTLSQIAYAIGLPRQTVFQWFHGTTPGSDKIALIAKAFGVSADWLITGGGEMLSGPPATGLSTHERDIVRFYRNAAPQRRKALYDMAKALAKAATILLLAIPPLLPSPAEAGFNIISDTIHIACRRLRQLLSWRLPIMIS